VRGVMESNINCKAVNCVYNIGEFKCRFAYADIDDHGMCIDFIEKEFDD